MRVRKLNLFTRYLCCGCFFDEKKEADSSASRTRHASIIRVLTRDKYSEADSMVIEKLYSDLRALMREYKEKEDFLLAVDYYNNVDFIRVIRSNPAVLFKRADKYSSLIISLASLRGKILQTRKRLEFYGELFPFEEEDIEGPDRFDEEAERTLSINPMSDLSGSFSSRSDGLSSGSESKSESLLAGSRVDSGTSGEIEGRLSFKWIESLDTLRKRGAVTPSWPSYLPELSFEVLKLNRVGQRLERTITLTPHYLQNKNSAGMVSKIYLYNQITKVEISKSGENCFSLFMESGREILLYSLEAEYIAKELLARINYRTKLDKMVQESSAFQVGDSFRLMKNIMKQISSEENMDSYKFLNELSLELKESFMSILIEDNLMSHNTVDELLLTSLNGDENPSNDVSNNPMLSSESLAASSAPAVIDGSDGAGGQGSSSFSVANHERNIVEMAPIHDNNKQPTAESNIDGGEGETAITEIEEAILKKRSSRRDSKIIADKMQSVADSHIEVTRPNIYSINSGTREYDAQAALRQLLQNQDSVEGSIRCKFLKKITLHKNYFAGLVMDDFYQEYASFVGGMQEHVLKYHGKQLSAILNREAAASIESLNPNSNLSDIDVTYITRIDSATMCYLSLLVFDTIEMSIAEPIIDHILKYPLAHIEVAEKDICSRMRVFSKRDQSKWDIDSEFCSPLNWKSAVIELSNLETKLTPIAMSSCLIRTANYIYSEFKHAVKTIESIDCREADNKNVNRDSNTTNNNDKHENDNSNNTDNNANKLENLTDTTEAEKSSEQDKNHLTGVHDSNSTREGRGKRPLGADDFVPIFIYVLCQSKIQHPLVVKEVLKNMSHPSLMFGEFGYYLTVYESALEFIASETMSPEESLDLDGLTRLSIAQNSVRRMTLQ